MGSPGLQDLGPSGLEGGRVLGICMGTKCHQQIVDHFYGLMHLFVGKNLHPKLQNKKR